ncbi:thiocillin family RiPP [Paenibacillus lacisoli]|uniref:thiocillin family RiPP n=1 Tax=Paenibacillus lacisoli TaxID=3064525 RepID=UPI00387E60B8
MEFDLYVEEILEEEGNFSSVMANCVASGSSYACFSCPGGCLSTTTSLSSATGG